MNVEDSGLRIEDFKDRWLSTCVFEPKEVTHMNGYGYGGISCIGILCGYAHVQSPSESSK